MAPVYGLLGVIVITTASKFGTMNASPWFNLAIAIVFVGLALAMFDVVTIDFSLLRRIDGHWWIGQGHGCPGVRHGGDRGAARGRVRGARGDPSDAVLERSVRAGNGRARSALPFLLGCGDGCPRPIAGAGLTALPKPGAWMVRVKQAFGVMILATAVYYGYLSYGLFADRWVDAKEVASSVEEKLKAGWHASLAEGLNVALLERKPVLIDMWATWCKNCLVMDRTTLADPAVTAALSGYVKIKFQAEQPDEEPARSVMDRFKAIGLPTTSSSTHETPSQRRPSLCPASSPGRFTRM